MLQFSNVEKATFSQRADEHDETEVDLKRKTTRGPANLAVGRWLAASLVHFC
jgi:hypothetical protein